MRGSDMDKTGLEWGNDRSQFLSWSSECTIQVGGSTLNRPSSTGIRQDPSGDSSDSLVVNFQEHAIATSKRIGAVPSFIRPWLPPGNTTITSPAVMGRRRPSRRAVPLPVRM